MPFDPNAWKRNALAHYLELARIDVPRAKEEAIGLAVAAEASSEGGLRGLVDAVKRELAKEGV